MKFALQGEHRDFFGKNGYIEFEGILSAHDVNNLKEAIDYVLTDRLKNLVNKTPQELFMAGRDVWRDSILIKKWTTSPTLSEIASSLFKIKPLRLAFDQALRTGMSTSPFLKATSLQQISSLRTIIGGLMIPLSEKPGSIVLLSAQYLIPFDTIFSQQNYCSLLIAYSGEKTLYTLDQADPHTHALKRQGYVFGDLLRNDTHPLVFR